MDPCGCRVFTCIVIRPPAWQQGGRSMIFLVELEAESLPQVATAIDNSLTFPVHVTTGPGDSKLPVGGRRRVSNRSNDSVSPMQNQPLADIHLGPQDHRDRCSTLHVSLLSYVSYDCKFCALVAPSPPSFHTTSGVLPSARRRTSSDPDSHCAIPRPSHRSVMVRMCFVWRTQPL